MLGQQSEKGEIHIILNLENSQSLVNEMEVVWVMLHKSSLHMVDKK